jgi:hypothetical protein
MALDLAHAIYKMGSVEDGYVPGPAMSTGELFITFVAIPVAMFVGISFIAYVATRDRRKTSDSVESVITSIQ